MENGEIGRTERSEGAAEWGEQEEQENGEYGRGVGEIGEEWGRSESAGEQSAGVGENIIHHHTNLKFFELHKKFSFLTPSAQ